VAGSSVAGGSSVGAAGAVGSAIGLSVAGTGVAVSPAGCVGDGASLGVAGALVAGSGVAVAVGKRVGLGVLVGSGLGVLVGSGVSTGSGAGLGPIVGTGVSVAAGSLVLAGVAGVAVAGWRGKDTILAAGFTIIVALELSDAPFEALIVTVLVHDPIIVAVKVTSITVNVFGASDPILVSLKPPGARQPPLTTSLSATLYAVASPRLPYPMANVTLDPTATQLAFANLITTRSTV
jgi:hypothetical protein